MKIDPKVTVPATNDVYVFQRPVKTVGKYYPIGTIMKGSDYNDPTKMRRGKIKITEGKVVLFPKAWGKLITDPNGQRAKRLQAKLGIETLSTDIINALVGTKAETQAQEPQVEVVSRSTTSTRKASAKKGVNKKVIDITKEA